MNIDHRLKIQVTCWLFVLIYIGNRLHSKIRLKLERGRQLNASEKSTCGDQKNVPKSIKGTSSPIFSWLDVLYHLYEDALLGNIKISQNWACTVLLQETFVSLTGEAGLASKTHFSSYFFRFSVVSSVARFSVVTYLRIGDF